MLQKPPKMHGTAPTTKNDPTQNVNSAEVEKTRVWRLWGEGDNILFHMTCF